MQYDTLVFIGRFQPFHNGHAKVIETAKSMAKKVVVLVGSANVPPNVRNPFLYDERHMVIEAWYKEEVNLDTSGLVILPLNDHTYNDQGWITEVQQLVDSVTYPHEKVGLIGHSKDHTSYYLKLFPQWGSVNVPAYTDRHLYNATDVRNTYFSENNLPAHEWSGLVEGLPKATFRFLDRFRSTDSFRHLFEVPFINLL